MVLLSCIYHHILIDGVSMNLLVRDLAILTNAIRFDTTPMLPPIRKHFVNYAVGGTDCHSVKGLPVPLCGCGPHSVCLYLYLCLCMGCGPQPVRLYLYLCKLWVRVWPSPDVPPFVSVTGCGCGRDPHHMCLFLSVAAFHVCVLKVCASVFYVPGRLCMYLFVYRAHIYIMCVLYLYCTLFLLEHLLRPVVYLIEWTHIRGQMVWGLRIQNLAPLPLKP